MVDVELYGNSKLHWLNTFLELPNGIPSHDTSGRVFSIIDAQQFQFAFYEWVLAVNEITKGQVINIDGKCLCSSDERQLWKRAVYMVNAWAEASAKWMKNQMKLLQSMNCSNHHQSQGSLCVERQRKLRASI